MLPAQGREARVWRGGKRERRRCMGVRVSWTPVLPAGELHSGCGSYKINNSLGLADSDTVLPFSGRCNYRWEDCSP